METAGFNAAAEIGIGVCMAQRDYFLSAMVRYSCSIERRGFITAIPGAFLAALRIHMKAS
jgi:hypothetical protein